MRHVTQASPFTGRARVAGVVGSPVAQSLSPLIHGAWIAAAGLDAAYVPFAPSPERFERLIEGFRGGAIRGLNVTAPFKAQALAAATRADAAARAAEAANLLLFEPDGAIEARNTDGLGLLEALAVQAPEWAPASGPAVILGAGGAASGAAAALVEAGVTQLRLVARTPARAQSLAARSGATVHGWDAISAVLEGATLVVNATTRGIGGIDPLAPPWPRAPRHAAALDMVYRPLRTTFLMSAAAAGWTAVDGLQMLIGQARPSFRAFYDLAPPDIEIRRLCLGALAVLDAA